MRVKGSSDASRCAARARAALEGSRGGPATISCRERLWRVPGGHHVTARAKGGKARTVDEIRVTCRKHNVLEACRDFGDGVVLRYTRGGRRRARAAMDATSVRPGEPDTPATWTP